MNKPSPPQTDKQLTYDPQADLTVFQLINARYEDIHSSVKDTIRDPKRLANINARKRKFDLLFDWAEKKWIGKGLVWDKSAQEFIPTGGGEGETMTEGKKHPEEEEEEEEQNDGKDQDESKEIIAASKGPQTQKQSLSLSKDKLEQGTGDIVMSNAASCDGSIPIDNNTCVSRCYRRPRRSTRFTALNPSLAKHLPPPPPPNKTRPGPKPKPKQKPKQKQKQKQKQKAKYQELPLEPYKMEIIYLRPAPPPLLLLQHKFAPLKAHNKPKKYRLSLDRLILLCQRAKINNKLKEASSSKTDAKTKDLPSLNKTLDLEPVGSNWRGVLLRRNVVRVRRWERS